MNGSQAAQVEPPKTTLELLKYIVKKIPERILKALPMTIIFGALMWLSHTFLLVYSNEGFSPDSWLGRNLLNVSGKLLSSTLLWTMLGLMLPMMVGFFRKGGNPFKQIGSMFLLPVDILNKNKATNGKFLPMVCFSCAIILFLNGFLSGVTSAFAGGLLISSIVSFVTGGGSIFVQVIRMIFSDVQMFVLKKKNPSLGNDSVFMVVGSSGLVLLFIGIIKSIDPLRNLGWFSSILFLILDYAWFAFALIGFILFLMKKNVAPTNFIFLFGFIGLAFLMSDLTNLIVFADDGGWHEAGGSFAAWLASEGALQATVMGLPPAIGGLAGVLISSIVGGIPGGLTGGGIGDIPSDAGTQPYEGEPYAGEPYTGEPQETEPEETEEEETEEEPEEGEDEESEEEPEEGEDEESEEGEEETEEEETEEEKKDRLEQEEKIRQQIAAQQEAKQKAMDELQRIQKEKAAHEAYVNSLCIKYNTTPDKLRDVLRENIGANAADAEKWNNYANNLQIAESAAQLTVVVADTAIDGLAACTGPTGKAWQAGYKVVKGTLVGATEARLDGKSVMAGATSGFIKGGSDAATDYTKSEGLKAGLRIGSEVIGGAITDGTDGAVKGLKNGIYNAAVSYGTDKVAGDGFGKDVSIVRGQGGKAGVIITGEGGSKTIKVVTNEVADKFVTNKVIKQGFTSGVKGTSAATNELFVKPTLQDAGVLPK